MVKPEKEKHESAETSTSNSSTKYKGVRKRKWGKYVSEIRLPNCRERIWLGSYDSAEKAARAFDAALFCLRGASAKFNFPDNPPDIPGGQSLNPTEIQAVAAEYAHSGPQIDKSSHSTSTSSSSSSEMCVDSPSPSVSNGPTQLATETTLDGSFIDLFSTMGSDYNVTRSYDTYPAAFDDFYNEFYVPPLPSSEYYYQEEQYDSGYSHDSLWNF